MPDLPLHYHNETDIVGFFSVCCNRQPFGLAMFPRRYEKYPFVWFVYRPIIGVVSRQSIILDSATGHRKYNPAAGAFQNIKIKKMKKLLLIVLIAANVCHAQTKRKLVWQENFKGKALDESVWNFELGDGCPNICGWGNNERQLYTKENHAISNGNLIIEARKQGEKYTSTRITTKGKKEFKYGRIECRAKLPTGQGIWPAFWMLGSNIPSVGWPKSGEIDILEYIGRDPHQVYTTLHTQDGHGDNGHSKKTEIANIEEGFHVFAVDWSKDKMDFFVDDKLVFTYNPEAKNLDNWPFDQPFYIIVNMAIGGNFGGPAVDDAIFPQQFTVDYIKVYQ